MKRAGESERPIAADSVTVYTPIDHKGTALIVSVERDEVVGRNEGRALALRICVKGPGPSTLRESNGREEKFDLDADDFERLHQLLGQAIARARAFRILPPEQADSTKRSAPRKTRTAASIATLPEGGEG